MQAQVAAAAELAAKAATEAALAANGVTKLCVIFPLAILDYLNRCHSTTGFNVTRCSTLSNIDSMSLRSF
eukprot:6200188-Amphidinium_carterae.1